METASVRVVLSARSTRRHDAFECVRADSGERILVVAPSLAPEAALLDVVVYEMRRRRAPAPAAAAPAAAPAAAAPAAPERFEPEVFYATSARPVARAPWSLQVARSFCGGDAVVEAALRACTADSTLEDMQRRSPRPSTREYLVWFHFEAALLFFLVRGTWPASRADVDDAYALSRRDAPLPASFAGRTHEAALAALGRPDEEVARVRAERQILGAHQRAQSVWLAPADLVAVDRPSPELVRDLLRTSADGRLALRWVADAAAGFVGAQTLAAFVDTDREPLDEGEVALRYVDEYDPAEHAGKVLVCDLRATHVARDGRLPVAFVRELPWTPFQKTAGCRRAGSVVERDSSRATREAVLRELFPASAALKPGAVLVLALRPEALAHAAQEAARARTERVVRSRVAPHAVCVSRRRRNVNLVNGREVDYPSFMRDFSTLDCVALHRAADLPSRVASVVVLFDAVDPRHEADAQRLGARVVVVRRQGDAPAAKRARA